VADPPDAPGQRPTDRLEDHLEDISDKSDQMQERLDELGEGIAAARRQAEADDLLPEGEDEDQAGRRKRRNTPINDTDFEAGG
jgi:hypothetical protein